MDISTEFVGVVVVGAVAVAMAVLAWLRGGGDVSTHLVDFQGAVEEAMHYVRAAEQLAATGKLEKSERFHYVFDLLNQRYPSLDRDVVAALVESAVAGLKMVKGND